MQTLADHARAQRLVIFAGAGVSMPAPSSLPNWKALNEAILASLARRLVVFTDKTFATTLLDSLIAERDNASYFTPDYQAQLIEDECGLEYFRVLQAVDSKDRNACHDAIASLAAHHHVAAIVTTNFDRLIEHALDAVGVVYRVYSANTHYEALGDIFAADPTHPLPVIKVHGSVEAPESMVDTLRQRLMGRPEALERALGRLLERHHLLFVGFSGADLAYDERYLGLRDAASSNGGFTCLVRSGDAPDIGMATLANAWGTQARFVHGMLPDWFDDLLVALQLPVAPPCEVTPGVDRMAAVTAHADLWAGSLGHMLAVAIITELLESSGRQALAFELLRRTLRSFMSERDMDAPGYGRFNYQLGRRLLERGTFDYGIDTNQGRKVEHEGGYSPFTANDCFQCLNRAAAAPFLHGEIDMGLYHAIRGRPERGAQLIRAARTQAWERQMPLVFVDACRSLGIVYEVLMKYADGLDWLERAHALACALGDEPRRARLCGELGRFLGEKQRFVEAHERLQEGYAIADKLALDVTRLELLSAEGSVLSDERRGPEAVARFALATTGLRQMERRPALTRALVAGCYAYFQARDWDGLHAARIELGDLVRLYEGYAPLVYLMESRLAVWTGADDARGWIDETKRVAALYENPGVIEEVEILERRLLAL